LTAMTIDGGAEETRDTLYLRDDGTSHQVAVRIPANTRDPKPPQVPMAAQNGTTPPVSLVKKPQDPTGTPTAVQ
jgi:hypothetical protein